MKIGLTLGKYAPLHRGHQKVIETAIAEMDHVIVLIYDVPATTSIPLPVRANWIRRIYPSVEVLEAWDGPLEVSNDPRVTAKHDAYLTSRLGQRGITHFYSSEFYGEHVSNALRAVDRRVDPDRVAISISATQIREDPFAHRGFMMPEVYRDYVTQAVFLGAPSTGKSTLVKALAENYKTAWVPEYGREYWEKNQVDRRLTLEQLAEIGVGHREREDVAIMDANEYLFVDTEAMTTRHFSMYYHDRCHPSLEIMANESALRYDLFFLCDTDIPYEDTWDRSGFVFREAFQRRIESDLRARRIPYIRLAGSLDQRMAKVKDALSRFRKFQGNHW